MKKWITDHPYFFVSAIFLAILFIGRQFLYWQEDKFAFLPLLYMIVILGIRMDDISKKIGRGIGKFSQDHGEKETISSQLKEIKSSLLTLNAALDKLLKDTEKEKH